MRKHLSTKTIRFEVVNVLSHNPKNFAARGVYYLKVNNSLALLLAGSCTDSGQGWFMRQPWTGTQKTIVNKTSHAQCVAERV